MTRYNKFIAAGIIAGVLAGCAFSAKAAAPVPRAVTGNFTCDVLIYPVETGFSGKPEKRVEQAYQVESERYQLTFYPVGKKRIHGRTLIIKEFGSDGIFGDADMGGASFRDDAGTWFSYANVATGDYVIFANCKAQRGF